MSEWLCALMEDAKVPGIKAISGGVEAKKERMKQGQVMRILRNQEKLFNKCFGSRNFEKLNKTCKKNLTLNRRLSVSTFLKNFLTAEFLSSSPRQQF